MVLVKVPDTDATAPKRGLLAPSSMYQSLCLILRSISNNRHNQRFDLQFHIGEFKIAVVNQRPSS